MYQRILVPLDGSDASERAVPLARILANRHGAELHLVHVLHASPDYAHRMPEEDVEWQRRAGDQVLAYLEGVAEELRESGAPEVTGSVLDGPVADALDAYREEHGVDLVVMTTHGEGGFRRWWLGSVADRLVRRIPVPLLLLRPWDETGDLRPGRERFEHVLVPLDGSGDAERALDHAVRFADSFRARLSLVRVISPGLDVGRFRGEPVVSLAPGLVEEARDEAREYLEGVVETVRERLGDDGPVVDAAVVEGTPADAILEFRRESGADLVTVATHGRGGLARVVLGSVADKVVRGSVAPVLVTRVPSEDEAG